ncbi:hypothetical protein CWC20_06980 [Pseudoalteromonas aurantia]|uniref:Uncharacterized protein n=1 Tax=Pseudoalteromonas aurantia TaxID=43654 RepID=A0ABY2VZQ8_9GAMM|nr:hypothetical protein CWC20_06980 [Pseudoalteromonas aurantia]
MAGLYAALFIDGLKRAINARLRWFGFIWGVGGALRRAFYWGFKASDKRSPTVVWFYLGGSRGFMPRFLLGV